MGLLGHSHVLEDLLLVPYVVAGRNNMRTKVEELFGDGRRNAESTGSVLAVDDEKIDSVRFEDVGEMFADDVAARRAEDVADEENVHLWILARLVCQSVCLRLLA